MLSIDKNDVIFPNGSLDNLIEEISSTDRADNPFEADIRFSFSKAGEKKIIEYFTCDEFGFELDKEKGDYLAGYFTVEFDKDGNYGIVNGINLVHNGDGRWHDVAPGSLNFFKDYLEIVHGKEALREAFKKLATPKVNIKNMIRSGQEQIQNSPENKDKSKEQSRGGEAL